VLHTQLAIPAHNAPYPQLIVTLGGVTVYTCSSGESVTLSAGDLLYVDDTAGLGHSTTVIMAPREVMTIPAPAGLEELLRVIS
jgi:hypothetical protein